MTTRRVVITGLGVIAPNGIGKEAYWSALIRGESAVRRIASFDPSKYRTQIAAEVRDFRPTDFVTPLRANQMWRFSQLAVASAVLATSDAGIPRGCSTLSQRAAVCFGTSMAGTADAELVHTRFLRGRSARRLSQFITECAPHSAASHVAIELGVTGATLTVSTNCCTGLDVIGLAHAQITSGLTDVVVAGAAEAPISPLTLSALSALGVLSTRNDAPALASRPYDRSRDGLVLGEGGGTIVLEELRSALTRGATIYAEVGGYASANEALDMRQTDAKGAFMTATLRAAMLRAGLLSRDIDYINAHGSSMPDYDICDTNAFKAAFGDRAYEIPISSIKSMIGQGIAVSGLFQTIASCLTFRDNLLPPTTNQEERDPACDLDYVPNRARSVIVNNILINAHAMGGGVSALVLRRFRPQRTDQVKLS